MYSHNEDEITNKLIFDGIESIESYIQYGTITNVNFILYESDFNNYIQKYEYISNKMITFTKINKNNNTILTNKKQLKQNLSLQQKLKQRKIQLCYKTLLKNAEYTNNVHNIHIKYYLLKYTLHKFLENLNNF